MNDYILYKGFYCKEIISECSKNEEDDILIMNEDYKKPPSSCFDIWEISEEEDRSGHLWAFSKSYYNTLDDCIIVIEKDKDYQYYLKKRKRLNYA